jgi:hypothetical protein
VIQTAATDVPRFNHNPTTGESLGLLVEESRSNLLLQSEDFSTTWAANTSTVSTNVAIAPNGTLTADKIIVNNGAASGFLNQGNAYTAGTTYTFSAYVKADGIAEFRIVVLAASFGASGTAIFNLTAGTASLSGSMSSVSIIPFPNGWYRVVATAAATITSTSSSRWQAQGTGDGTAGILIWGAQLEAGAFPTSYIKNVDTAAGVTRSADLASISNANLLPWFTSFDEHTFYAELRGGPPKGLGSLIMEGLVSGAIGGVSLSLNNTSTRFRSQQRHGVARFDSGNNNGGILASTINRVAVRASALGSQSADNGLLPAAGSAPTQVDWNTGASIAFGKRSTSSTLFLNGYIARIVYWPQPLANSTLQQITQ